MTDLASFKSIFHAVLQLPESRRKAFLDRTCGSDAAMRREIDLLLAAHDDTPVLSAETLDTPRSSKIAPAFNSPEACKDADPAESTANERGGSGGGGGGGWPTIPGCTIEREIHRGGQGVVYLAIQRSTRREVAVKVMKKGAFANASERARFEREVQLLAELQHPNIVTIHDSGIAGDHAYFIMNYVSGRSLADYLEAGQHPIDEVVRMFMVICEAVEAAHAREIIHRDLKPGNICLDEQRNPHILDFGIARRTIDSDEFTAMTLTGQFIGSLPWASPEQAAAHPAGIDLRTDVYSLGVILYQLLTGRFPYEFGSSLASYVYAIENVAPAPPRGIRKDLPADLETIVLKCLSKERERRYPSAGALARDLRRFLNAEPIEARRDSRGYLVAMHTRRTMRRHPWGAGLAAVLIASLVANVTVMPLATQFTPIDRWFRRAMTTYFSPAWGTPHLNNVRLIGLTEHTDIDAIGRRESLKEVSKANLVSWRRMHGRLMERLAESGVRAVAWDIVFRKPTEFDEDFVKGVRALKKAGVDVIVGSASWATQANGLPEMSPVILPEIRWGARMAILGPDEPWSLELALSRWGIEPRSSLVLETFAACQQPRSAVALAIDESANSIHLSYWKPVPNIPRARLVLDRADEIVVSNKAPVPPGLLASPDNDLRLNDLLVQYHVPLPTDQTLSQATVDYGTIFSADANTLRSTFDHRVAVIGDFRPGIDRYATPDGRTLPGAVAHAVGIDALLDRFATRTPDWWATPVILIVIGAISGAMIAWRLGARSIQWISGLTALSLVTLVICVLAYRSARYLCDPIAPLVALWLACLMTVPLKRLLPIQNVDQ